MADFASKTRWPRIYWACERRSINGSCNTRSCSTSCQWGWFYFESIKSWGCEQTCTVWGLKQLFNIELNFWIFQAESREQLAARHEEYGRCDLLIASGRLRDSINATRLLEKMSAILSDQDDSKSSDFTFLFRKIKLFFSVELNSGSLTFGRMIVDVVNDLCQMHTVVDTKKPIFPKEKRMRNQRFQSKKRFGKFLRG